MLWNTWRKRPCSILKADRAKGDASASSTQLPTHLHRRHSTLDYPISQLILHLVPIPFPQKARLVITSRFILGVEDRKNARREFILPQSSSGDCNQIALSFCLPA